MSINVNFWSDWGKRKWKRNRFMVVVVKNRKTEGANLLTKDSRTRKWICVSVQSPQKYLRWCIVLGDVLLGASCRAAPPQFQCYRLRRWVGNNNNTLLFATCLTWPSNGWLKIVTIMSHWTCSLFSWTPWTTIWNLAAGCGLSSDSGRKQAAVSKQYELFEIICR